VAKDDDVALDLRELLERGGQGLRELAAAVLGALVDRAGLFAEDRAAAAQVVDRQVVGDAQQPR
jgi:hypothetical protein